MAKGHGKKNLHGFKLRNMYFTISGPYGNLWRGGRALNPFPFSQQAKLPRPQSNQRPVQHFRAQPHPEAELRHQTKATQSEQVRLIMNKT